MVTRPLVLLIYLQMASNWPGEAVIQGTNPYKISTLPPLDPSWKDANLTKVYTLRRRTVLDLEEIFECPGEWYLIEQFILNHKIIVRAGRVGIYYCIIQHLTMYTVFLLVINKPLTLGLKGRNVNQTEVYKGFGRTLICDARFLMSHATFRSTIKMYNSSDHLIGKCDAVINESDVSVICASDVEFPSLGAELYRCSMDFAVEYKGRRAADVRTTNTTLTVEEAPEDYTRAIEKTTAFVSSSTRLKISPILFLYTKLLIF